MSKDIEDKVLNVLLFTEPLAALSNHTLVPMPPVILSNAIFRLSCCRVSYCKECTLVSESA